jgi:hypothetical protein
MPRPGEAGALRMEGGQLPAIGGERRAVNQAGIVGGEKRLSASKPSSRLQRLALVSAIAGPPSVDCPYPTKRNRTVGCVPIDPAAAIAQRHQSDAPIHLATQVHHA